MLASAKEESEAAEVLERAHSNCIGYRGSHCCRHCGCFEAGSQVLTANLCAKAAKVSLKPVSVNGAVLYFQCDVSHVKVVQFSKLF